MPPPAGSSSSRSSRRRSRSRSSSRSRSRHRSSSPGRDSSPITERVIDYKAAFLALQVRNEADAQKKRKRGPAQTSGSTQAMGRGFRMLAVLFGEISMVISAAETYLLDPFPPVTYDEFSEDLTPEQEAFLVEKRGRVTVYPQERNLGAYLQMKRLVPNLERKLTTSEPAEVIEFYRALQKGANDSRSDDFGKITGNLGDWINADRDRPDIAVFDHTPPILNDKGELMRQYGPWLVSERLNRGVENDVCGGLLSTVEHDWSLPEHVVFRIWTRRKLRSGDLDLNESFYCRIFYLGFQGDKNNIDVGFLKSRYLVRGYKSVFTGPTSAKFESENTPASKKPKTTTKSVRKP
ncbi:hypothetical protein B0H17DRAFT_1216464, partial [Mycena rosella]